jgi:hypothetical protein
MFSKESDVAKLAYLGQETQECNHFLVSCGCSVVFVAIQSMRREEMARFYF